MITYFVLGGLGALALLVAWVCTRGKHTEIFVSTTRTWRFDVPITEEERKALQAELAQLPNMTDKKAKEMIDQVLANRIRDSD